MKKPVVVLGGGLAGLAAAYYLSQSNIPVTLIEKEKTLGGVAASVRLPDGRQVPVAYHHIVSTDRPLMNILKELGLISRVSWRKISIAAKIDGKTVNLASPSDILLKLKRLSFLSRFRYLLFAARCLATKNWQAWEGHSVDELIRKWADTNILKEIFTPLTDIKFGLKPEQVDAAWLGQRLGRREAATPFGCIPNASWPAELCAVFEEKIKEKGGRIMLEERVKSFSITANRITKIKTSQGKIVEPRAVISTLPPPVLVSLLKKVQAPKAWLKTLEKIRYISSYSLLAGLPFEISKNYWMIALSPRRVFGACFNLSVLNETLITPKDACMINIFTNVAFEKFPWSNGEYVEKARQDLSETSGRPINFNWVKVNRIKYSTPIFDRNYLNPPPCLGENLFLAGIYTTYPRFSSTGSAVESGKVAAQKLIEDLK